MKGLNILSAIIILLLIPFAIFMQTNISLSDSCPRQEVLTEIMQKSGASVHELSLEAWKKINDRDPDIEFLKKVLEPVVKEFNAKVIEDVSQSRDGFSSARVTAVIKGGDSEEVLTAAAQNVDGKFYLVVRLEGRNLERIALWEEKIKNIFSYYDRKPNMSINVTGLLSQKFTGEEREKLVKELFRHSGAKITEGINTEKLVSYSGFCPRLPDELNIEGKRINLNIAARNHPEDNRTYIFIGTPVLTSQY